jgi:hypothetical protein
VLKRLHKWPGTIPSVLFGGVLLSLLLTMAPSIYTLDSAEFALGAKTLGIVHAPGYPLYLLLAHLFTYLPVGDVAFRVNLFSALTLALSAPVIYDTLRRLVPSRWVATTSALVFVWSYYGWINGLVAEVYAPQIFTLSVTGWLLVRQHERVQDTGTVSARLAIITGLWYGFTVALVPSSIFVAGGVIAAFLLLRVPLKTALAAATLAVLIYVVPLAYFPLRAQADPALNMAGTYTPAGDFDAYDLQSPAGIWTMVRAEPFDHLVFAEGYLPTPTRLVYFVRWFVRNTLGLGLLVGMIGLYPLYKHARGVLIVWACFALPYSYFFLTYGAADVKLMFSPFYLAWTVPFAYGLHWFIADQDQRLAVIACVALSSVFFAINYPRVNSRGDTAIRDEARAILAYVPPDSLIFGQWLDVVPLQYVQAIDDTRRDVTIYNLELFDPAPYFPFFEERGQPLYVLDKRSVTVYGNLSRYTIIEHTLGARVIYELQR